MPYAKSGNGKRKSKPNTRKMARQEHRQIVRTERKEERAQRRIDRSTGLEREPKVTKRQIRKWS